MDLCKPLKRGGVGIAEPYLTNALDPFFECGEDSTPRILLLRSRPRTVLRVGFSTLVNHVQPS